MGATACGWLADSTSRLSLTKCILSWNEEMLVQDVHIIVQTTKAHASSGHKAPPGGTIALHSTAGWVPLVGFPADKYPPITLSSGQPELSAEDHLAQWSMVGHCPVLNHLDQRTPVLDWWPTRRPSRMGSVLVGARFTDTKDDIFYSSLTAMQIASYLMLGKGIFIQCDDLGPLFWRQIRTCTHDRMMVCTETDFEGAGVFVGSRQAPPF